MRWQSANFLTYQQAQKKSTAPSLLADFVWTCQQGWSCTAEVLWLFVFYWAMNNWSPKYCWEHPGCFEFSSFFLFPLSLSPPCLHLHFLLLLLYFSLLLYTSLSPLSPHGRAKSPRAPRSHLFYPASSQMKHNLVWSPDSEGPSSPLELSWDSSAKYRVWAHAGPLWPLPWQQEHPERGKRKFLGNRVSANKNKRHQLQLL